MYQLILVQQPHQARMSGLSLRDRRHVDPPPILKLVVVTDPVTDPNGLERQRIMDDLLRRSLNFIVHATLLVSTPASMINTTSPSHTFPLTDSPSHITITAPTPLPTSPTSPALPTSPIPISPPDTHHYHTNHQVIMGSLVSCCHILTDLEGERGAFFVFSDLAVRASGAFRLKFDLFDVSSARTDGTLALASAISDIFHVYSPKTFPGMSDSTPLTKWFAKQGIKLFVRWDGGGKEDEEDG
ncbi:velvet factor [Chytridium lagenaria]|nr:velvet factor [Chytridium lagenaria]